MTMNSGVESAGGPRQELAGAAALFRSLGDPTRLAIARRLAKGEARVVDLMGELGMVQSTVSSHISCLRECGLVIGRPQGRQVFYSLAHPELMDMFAAAEQLLAATGEAVALCPTYGTDTPAPTATAAATVTAAGDTTKTDTTTRDAR